MYDHINFIYRPDPIVIRVVEVTPPEPPKLMGLIQQVLRYAQLPPMRPILEPIDLRNLCSTIHPTDYLVPCRSGGLEDLGAPVHFLDERPVQRRDWALIGCERSVQFHRHYYGCLLYTSDAADERSSVDLGGRRIIKKKKTQLHGSRRHNVIGIHTSAATHSVREEREEE